MKSGSSTRLLDILHGKIPPSRSFIKRFNRRLRECICWGRGGEEPRLVSVQLRGIYGGAVIVADFRI